MYLKWIELTQIARLHNSGQFKIYDIYCIVINTLIIEILGKLYMSKVMLNYNFIGDATYSKVKIILFSKNSLCISLSLMMQVLLVSW